MIDINNLFQTCRNYILNVWKLWGEKTSEPRLPTSIVFSSMEVALHHHDAVQHLFISVVGMILRCMLQTNHHHSPLCGHNLTLFCSFNTSPLPSAAPQCHFRCSRRATMTNTCWWPPWTMHAICPTF